MTWKWFDASISTGTMAERKLGPPAAVAYILSRCDGADVRLRQGYGGQGRSALPWPRVPFLRAHWPSGRSALPWPRAPFLQARWPSRRLRQGYGVTRKRVLLGFLPALFLFEFAEIFDEVFVGASWLPDTSAVADLVNRVYDVLIA